MITYGQQITSKHSIPIHLTDILHIETYNTSTSEFTSTESDAGNSDTLSLSYSTSNSSEENTHSGGELEPYLYEPVASHNDTPEDDGDDADDDSQDSERLLATDWYKTLQFNDL